MAQPPQFRPGPPGGFGPPGPPGAPQGPPGPPSPGVMRPSYPADPFRGSQNGDGRKKKDKKKRRDDSSSDEDDCKCPPSQPATQIFITPPGMPPPIAQNCGCCDASNCADGSSRNKQQDYTDPAKLCQLQCFQGMGRQEDTQTQVICCPPTQCRGCQQKKRQQRQQTCCECGADTRAKKQKKPQYGAVEGMMPATQQFLMFLQAYGLAAALIRDRNKREDERAEKEREEKKRSSREEISADRKAKQPAKDKGKKKKDKEPEDMK